MSRSIQLVLLCVVTLSYIQLGRSDCDCNETQSSIASLRNDLTCVKESLNSLSAYTCGGTGGWRRAVYLDMTNPNTNCPEGWSLTDYSKRTCGRATDALFTCDSVTFPVSGGAYSQMCGKIIGYQWGDGGAFHPTSFEDMDSVDETYFTGVAVMHGSPRQHIWTFAVGQSENNTVESSGLCPCDSATNAWITVPSFVGEDYFCESGYLSGNGTISRFHSYDPLWDGKGCDSSSTCCSLHNPPYFTKTLNASTTDDIELRMCIFGGISLRNVAIELVELYVK